MLFHVLFIFVGAALGALIGGVLNYEGFKLPAGHPLFRLPIIISATVLALGNAACVEWETQVIFFCLESIVIVTMALFYSPPEEVKITKTRPHD